MKKAFTILELLMSITILAIMLLLSFVCFNAVVSSWTAGIEMSDSMAQADYVMNQIESGLRSAYFSTTVAKEMERGFCFIDDGEKDQAHDTLEWMKLGRAFVGLLRDIDGKTELAEIPHRVKLFVRDEKDNEDGEGFGLMARAWCNDFRDETETEEEKEASIRSYLISPRVMAMDCKVLKEPPDANAKEIKWEDEWSSSNSLPYKVSVTLYLRPVKDGEDPITLTRDITIPVWEYSQNPGSADGGSSSGARRNNQKGGTKTAPGGSEAPNPAGRGGQSRGGVAPIGGGMAPMGGGGAPM